MFSSGRGIGLRSNRGLPEDIWCGCIAAAAVATVAFGASGPGGASVPLAPSGLSDKREAPDRLPWTDSNCGSCHDTDRQLMHPIDRKPSMPVPDGLPLTDGRITCVTRHEAAAPEQHAAARSNQSDLLRMPAEQLCAQCHTESAADKSNDHAGLVTKAHLNTSEFQSSQSLPGIDKQSLTCMSCHDGSLNLTLGTAVASAGNALMAGFHTSSQKANSHPIGSVYPSHSGRGAKAMVPQSRLDGRVRLFDNAIGCGSCHSPYSQEDNLLVINNRGSQLCLSCHAL